MLLSNHRPELSTTSTWTSSTMRSWTESTSWVPQKTCLDRSTPLKLFEDNLPQGLPSLEMIEPGRRMPGWVDLDCRLAYSRNDIDESSSCSHHFNPYPGLTDNCLIAKYPLTYLIVNLCIVGDVVTMACEHFQLVLVFSGSHQEC